MPHMRYGREKRRERGSRWERGEERADLQVPSVFADTILEGSLLPTLLNAIK